MIIKFVLYPVEKHKSAVIKTVSKIYGSKRSKTDVKENSCKGNYVLLVGVYKSRWSRQSEGLHKLSQNAISVNIV
jgi:hypothetical protein